MSRPCITAPFANDPVAARMAKTTPTTACASATDSQASAPKKRRKAVKTTTLTKAWFEARGYRIAYVQRTVWPGPGKPPISFDAFGFADHFAFKVEHDGMIAVNSCAVDRLADHAAKFLALPIVAEYLRVRGNRIMLFGWERRKKRGEGPRLRIDELEVHPHSDELVVSTDTKWLGI